MTANDTIAAIAAAPGEAAISIVRISGPNSLAIADAIFRRRAAPPSQTPGGSFLYGHILSDSGAGGTTGVLDEVVLLVFRAPHSYTREDVIEIQCHGGRASARRVLDAGLKAGARPAEPGEFTRRAFMNGRIDLLQAEAVADLIRAQSDRAAAAAIEQLEGSLTRSFGEFYDLVLSAASDLEATLDFLEDEIPPETMIEIGERLVKVRDKAKKLLATWEEGHVLREGALVVICGRPNVGKSTLLNSLLGKERAIVTDVPGTTRDTIEETMIMDGFPIRLVDTAGLRATECRIESEGVVRAQALMAKAEVQVYMLDCSQVMHEEDRAVLSGLKPDRTVVVLNKTDLGMKLTAKDVIPHVAVSSSLIEGQGLDEVCQAIMSRLGIWSHGEPRATISERHRQIIQNALNAMNEAIALVKSEKNDAMILAANALHVALENVASATGRTCSEELLHSIFTKFCIGK
ncbi:MAG: tRNA uridine-5-carboxymethylaminomethyl(34) synthesis GTPase MnmE [Verrucomicrobiota bacterium]|nr:tRNA uridine-5-carboxymethylaminomethyl(34) synthesis GTPase MnmE [Verrucomicrobiota bacterium]